MNKRNVALLFSVLVMLVGQLLGETGPPIYVSTFTLTGGGQILSVDGTTGATRVVYTSTNNILQRPEDLTVGPDNRLYVCDPTNGQIVRMDQDGTQVETVYDQATATSSPKPTGPQGPQFDLAGTLLFNTKGPNFSGVWRIDGLAAIPVGKSFPAPSPVLSATQSGEGLALINGDLLIANRSDIIGLGVVQRSPGPLFASAKPIITELYDPIGIAVNGVGDIFVARGRSLNDIQRFTMTSNNVYSRTPFVDFFPDRPNYLQFALDDTLFVATADATLQNGKLWKVTTKGEKILLAGKIPPAVGVGVPKSITKTFTGTKAYNFGSNSFEVTAEACTATITARQRPPTEVNQMLQASGIKDPVQLLSGEVWATTWLIEPSVCSPPLGSDGYYRIAIAYFVDSPFNINPRIVRCDVSPTDASLTGCKQLPDFGYYPQGPLLGVPGDPISGTKSRSFSEYLLVNLPLAPNVNFCGFLSPLNPDPNNPAVFLIGNTIPFKFKLTTGLKCTGSFITDAKAVLSVAQIKLGDGTPTFDRKLVNSSGNANEPPTFRSDGPTKQYIFNLNTSGWTAGLYTATVTLNKGLPQTIFFKLK